MSFSSLRDIFIGRVGADDCVRSILFLKSPRNVKEYLVRVHNATFPAGESEKDERMRAYPYDRRKPSVIPIKQRDLSNPDFMDEQANKLSFDISRFIEFLNGYAKVDDDIKPMMLHYSMIYLFDFFSRTWLKYGQNWGHGIALGSYRKRLPVNEYPVKIKKSGIFPRAVDAFYLLGQSSLFSLDYDDGIGLVPDPFEGRVPAGIKKMKYSETQEITLNHLIGIYEKIDKIVGYVSISNRILTGYVILFIMSSISRYRAADWDSIRRSRGLKNKSDLLQYDFLYKWTPEILKQTILKRRFKPPAA